MAKDVTRLYNALTHDAQGAIETASSPEVAERVRTGVQALGASCMKLVQNGGDVQANPRDPISMRDLADAARKVAEKVRRLHFARNCPWKLLVIIVNIASKKMLSIEAIHKLSNIEWNFICRKSSYKFFSYFFNKDLAHSRSSAVGLPWYSGLY